MRERSHLTSFQPRSCKRNKHPKIYTETFGQKWKNEWMLNLQHSILSPRDLLRFDLFPLLLIFLCQSRMFSSQLLVFLNPDSANDHCLISPAVMMSCSSHYKDYQEMVAPGERRKRPCLSWAEPVLVIATQPCTWPQWHAKYTLFGTHGHTHKHRHTHSALTRWAKKHNVCHTCNVTTR